MKIETVRIQNFRAFKDQTIPFDTYTCLVGPNGAGKSTVITALNIFFRNNTDSPTNMLELDEEDFHHKNTELPITITVTFTDLSVEAQEDLSHYFRNGKLVFSAIAKWDPETKKAQVSHFGERLVIRAFALFFEAERDGKLVPELRRIYSEIRSRFAALPNETTKPRMIEALRQYEESHPEEASLEPSSAQPYGFPGNAQYRLEKHIQWVHVPAVKDAASEQQEGKRTAIGQILERTVRAKISFAESIRQIKDDAYNRYLAVLQGEGPKLVELAQSLTARLRDWAHPDVRIRLSWYGDPSKVLIPEPVAQVTAGEGAFEGHLPRFGHGLQRSFLLALLQELAEADTGAEALPTLILACEEPELYQHPPQIRHLASVFNSLAGKGTQIIVCTHNPIFVRGGQFEEVRYVTKNRKNGESVVRRADFRELAEAVGNAGGETPARATGTALKVSQALQPVINEMFFTPVLVLVEGLEDVAYLSCQFVLSDLWQEFRRMGGHLVPCGGKSKMVLPLAIANILKIPTFVMFDADADKCTTSAKKTQHTRDNNALLNLCGLPATDRLPSQDVWTSGAVMWKDDIASAVAVDFGTEWDERRFRVKKNHTLEDVDDVYKSHVFIEYFLSDMWDENKQSSTLERVCKSIVTFARTVV